MSAMPRSRSLCVVLLLMLGLGAVGLAACGGANKGSRKGSEQRPGTTDKGRFVLSVQAPNRDDRDAAELLNRSGIVSGVVKAVNETVALPRDVDVVIASTDQGPAYDASTRTLVIGYPFVSYVAGVFEQADPSMSREQLAGRTVAVVGFVLLHEMGHALIDQLKLPVTGREEDSVDNLATVITASDPDASEVALDFADFFALLQKDPRQLRAVDFWDEHSLDIQRANEAVCLVYGSDPATHRDLADSIAPDRRDSCPEEWKKISSSWEQLLTPHQRS